MTIANTSHEVGELVVGGDWACAHGDFSTLHFIGERLATHAASSLKTKLLAFAEHCLDNPERAATEWASLRTRCFNPH
jgi:hypothetical protein